MAVPLLPKPPLLDEIFFEFENNEGELFLLHELKVEEKYNLIITQKAGFTRYRIGDQVQVVSHFEQTPCLKFLGRAAQVCDIVGEKLNEIFVREALSDMLNQLCQFWVLVPVVHGANDIYYLCLMDVKSELSPLGIEQLQEKIDQKLQEALHYRNARLLGQLNAVQIQLSQNLSKLYYDFFNSLGMKWGDIKYTSLITNLTHSESLINYIGREKEVIDHKKLTP